MFKTINDFFRGIKIGNRCRREGVYPVLWEAVDKDDYKMVADILKTIYVDPMLKRGGKDLICWAKSQEMIIVMAACGITFVSLLSASKPEVPGWQAAYAFGVSLRDKIPERKKVFIA